MNIKAEDKQGFIDVYINIYLIMAEIARNRFMVKVGKEI